MLLRPRREEDKTYLKWIRTQPEWECLITGNRGEDIDACHLRSKGAGGSDYFVFPLRHELHMQMDHSPRGSAHGARESRMRDELSLWWYNLPAIHKRYFEAHPMKADAQCDTYWKMREVCFANDV